jgi:hypothetical protein
VLKKAHTLSKYSRPYSNEEAKAPDMAIDIIGCLGRAKDEAYRDYTTSLVAAYLVFESRSTYQA